MVFVDIPPTDAVRSDVFRSWGLSLDGTAVRLYGGEESASYRVGTHVIRIGPTWRSLAELEWAYSVAAQVAAQVPEVPTPVPAQRGAYSSPSISVR
jgi:hypothetical protein